MIKELTGGDVCFGQPVNTIGVFVAIVVAIICWELIQLIIRR